MCLHLRGLRNIRYTLIADDIVQVNHKTPPDGCGGMGAKREFRDREEREVAVLDALVEQPEEGLTVFELRSHADVTIDDLETALGNLKADDLIEVEENGDRTVIVPDERVVPDPDEPEEESSVIDRIRDRLPL